MKALVLACALILSPSLLNAGNLLRIHVAHTKTRNGSPEQIISVFFWPEPGDRALHLVGSNSRMMRVSSVRLYGLESKKLYTFEWRLPRSLTPADDEIDPYVITATILDSDGNVAGTASTQFFVS